MSTFKFLHAADLHLDSPLRGLANKSADFAQRVERASRQAFDNLVDVAIADGVAFVVLAGDVFDGDLRNFQTGLYFTSGMRRLEAAGIRVFLIAGNHDAENRYAGRLKHSANVHLFAHKAAETVELDDLRVAIHGQSFAQRDVIDNLARAYPPPRQDYFNIGVLHTACTGSEGPHAVYAPCTVEQLVNHGYDYWALGHVHARAVLNEHPHVVYPGNLQGRHIRETGPKGATMVTVADGVVSACEHRDLDVVRWARVNIDLSEGVDLQTGLDLANAVIEAVCAEAGDRPTALRVRLQGETVLDGDLRRAPTQVREEVEAWLASRSDDAWLEKLDISTQAPSLAATVDPSVSGGLRTEIATLASELDASLDACLKDIQAKMPAQARVEELFARLRERAPKRALALALSLVGGEEGDRAD